MSNFKTVTLFLKPNTQEAIELAEKICEYLSEKAIKSLIAVCDGANPECMFYNTNIKGSTPVSTDKIPQENNLAIVLGGDGTFLSASSFLYGNSSPILGINLGNIGFLTETEANEAINALKQALADDIASEERPYFLATVKRKGKIIFENAPLINDVVIQRDASQKMINFNIVSGNRDVTSNRADGIIIATPTGSTAYSLSTGGPIVSPKVDALILAPICPHKLSYRPIVIPAWNTKITVDSLAHLSVDGRKNIKLMPDDVVEVTKSEYNFIILHSVERNFFSLLRTKLGWDS